jgi:hypothetical protein
MNKNINVADYKDLIKFLIDNELFQKGFINESDNTERFSEKLSKKIIELKNISEDYSEELIEFIEDTLIFNYENVTKIEDNSDCTRYYYNNNLYKFETVKELENKFLIGA